MTESHAPSTAAVDVATDTPPPDPREFRYIRVGDLVVDDRKQRKIDPRKAQAIADAFDWAKFEALTVVATDMPGKFDVVEGQHRSGGALLRGGDDLMVPCMVLPVTSTSDQAALALDITKGRKAHTIFERWRLAVLAGSVREVLATQELTRRGLRVASTTSSTTISAVATLLSLCKSGTPDAAAALLGKVLDTLLEAFPDVNSAVTRWDRALLTAVADIHRQNGDKVDQARLVATLQVRPAVQWVSIGNAPDRTTTAALTLKAKLVTEYNRYLRARRLV